MSGRRIQPVETTGVMRVIAKPVLVSVGAGALVCIAILLLMSLLMAVKSIPQAMVGPMAVFALMAGALAGGFCCSKLLRRNGLVMGAICGFVMCLVVLLAGFSLPHNIMGTNALFKVVYVLLASMLGGVLGVNTRSGRR